MNPVRVSGFNLQDYTVVVDGLTKALSAIPAACDGKALSTTGPSLGGAPLLGERSPCLRATSQDGHSISWYPMSGGPVAQSFWYAWLAYYDTKSGEVSLNAWLAERGLSAAGTTHERIVRLIAHECARWRVPLHVKNGPVAG